MASHLCCKLMECAKAIEGGNLDLAGSLLAEIQSLASKEASFPTRKVVQYCVEALVRRVCGILPPCPLPLLTLQSPSHYKYHPFYHFADLTTKHAISDALSSGNKRLHIIDFSILLDPYGWNGIIEDLKKQHGGLQWITLTSIVLKLPKRSDRLRLKDQLFIEYAQRLEGVKLEGRQLICNSTGDIVKSISKIRRKRKDEMMVVIWDFILHRLLAQDGAIEQVLSRLKDLEVDFMLILEQEANLNSPDFSHRLQQAFQYYGHVFESMEKWASLYDTDLLLRERYFRRQIENVVACEGIDRVERIESFAQWQHHLSQAGFCPVPQQLDKFKKDFQKYLKQFGVEEKDGHMLLCWKSFPLAAASFWKCTDPPPLSGGLYATQDTVDDLEMGRSSESEDDEANDSLDINLWPTQGGRGHIVIPEPALNDGALQSIITNKRRKISSVWDRFDKNQGENGEVWATFKYCKKNYKAESKRGTSNLHKHLKSFSPSRQDNAEQQSSNFVETGDLLTSIIQRNFVINQERSRLDIATMMIKHGFPFHMVQGETLQPLFKLCSQDVVEAADVLAICRQEKEKLIKYFDNLSCLLSLTFALWSSNDKMKTYCCLTLHFIDDGWELKKKILAFRSLKYNCDMGTVHEVFKSVLIEWSISKNVRFIFFDITPPNDHMIGELRMKVSNQVPCVHEQQFCVSSYAQILSLLVQDGFSEIRSVLYKIRECIEYVNESPLTRQKFQEAINNVRLQDIEMTTLDVPTRWETTFLMLESSLEFRRAFNQLEQFDGDFKVNPSAEEWNKATGVYECLKEFRNSTCNFPTSVEDYFLNVHDVYKNLLKWKHSEHVYVRSMANKMQEKFDEYWGEASLALGISVVLNPCFKLDLVVYGHQQIYGNDAFSHLFRFRHNLMGVYKKYANDFSNVGPSSSAIADASLNFEEWRKGKYEQLNEINQYLEQPPVNLDKDCNILAWWQDNAQKFPLLGKMARDFLTIPISTIISKSSLTKEVMKMASVLDGGDPEMVEALICGKDW